MNKILSSLFDMIVSLSNVIDMISPEMYGHQSRVAYIADRIAKEMGIEKKKRKDIIFAGLLHDCGALSFKERIDALHFDIDESINTYRHAEIGYCLLRNFKPLEKAAGIIRYHHTSWRNCSDIGAQVPFESHILYLADRIDTLCKTGKGSFACLDEIYELIKKCKGIKFWPDAVDAFISLTERENIINDMSRVSILDYLNKRFYDTELDIYSILIITKVFEKMIDFRSRFTASHSSGVAAVAYELAKIVGMNEDECEKIKVSGYLHDIGKLAVPLEILEKPGSLTKMEYAVVKSHACHTYRTLINIKGFEEINEYASFHHELISGKGYPFGIKGERLTIGSRIMCVSDIFTAIAEDRPYRRGMTISDAFGILDDLVKNNGIDGKIVAILKQYYDQINSIRLSAQSQAIEEFEKFQATVDMQCQEILSI